MRQCVLSMVATMQAMILAGPGEPLRMTELPMPVPGEHDIVIRVLACGICRTDLHIIDGDLPPRVAGIVPGHEVVGRVVVASIAWGTGRICATRRCSPATTGAAALHNTRQRTNASALPCLTAMTMCMQRPCCAQA